MLRKEKQNRGIKCVSVYHNSSTKTVIIFKYDLNKSFQEVLYRIDNWINERPGWIIEILEAEYVDIFVYSPLSGSLYIKLSCELKNSMKSLINIKSSDNKGFLWCHIKYLNSEKIARADKEMINDFDYDGIEFPVSRKYFGKIENKNNICINVFCYENNLVYPVQI